MAFLMTVSFAEISSSYDVVWSFSVSNYRDLLVGQDGGLFQTPFVDSLLLSLGIAAITTFFTVVLAYPVAYLLTRLSGRRFKIVLFAVLVPFFTIFIVRIYSWFAFFGQSGLINSMLITIGVVSEPVGHLRIWAHTGDHRAHSRVLPVYVVDTVLESPRN